MSLIWKFSISYRCFYTLSKNFLSSSQNWFPRVQRNIFSKKFSENFWYYVNSIKLFAFFSWNCQSAFYVSRGKYWTEEKWECLKIYIFFWLSEKFLASVLNFPQNPRPSGILTSSRSSKTTLSKPWTRKSVSIDGWQETSNWKIFDISSGNFFGSNTADSWSLFASVLTLHIKYLESQETMLS